MGVSSGTIFNVTYNTSDSDVSPTLSIRARDIDGKVIVREFIKKVCKK